MRELMQSLRGERMLYTVELSEFSTEATTLGFANLVQGGIPLDTEATKCDWVFKACRV